MAFSWKKTQKRTIKHMKYRVEIFLKEGENKQALKLKDKIKRLSEV